MSFSLLSTKPRIMPFERLLSRCSALRGCRLMRLRSQKKGGGENKYEPFYIKTRHEGTKTTKQSSINCIVQWASYFMCFLCSCFAASINSRVDILCVCVLRRVTIIVATGVYHAL
jgi:hypothetical protein